MTKGSAGPVCAAAKIGAIASITNSSKILFIK
jgi:hypothetical protein